MQRQKKRSSKTKIDEEVTKAKHSIDQAITNNDVDQAKNIGNNTINNIQAEVVKKRQLRMLLIKLH